MNRTETTRRPSGSYIFHSYTFIGANKMTSYTSGTLVSDNFRNTSHTRIGFIKIASLSGPPSHHNSYFASKRSISADFSHACNHCPVHSFVQYMQESEKLHVNLFGGRSITIAYRPGIFTSKYYDREYLSFPLPPMARKVPQIISH